MRGGTSKGVYFLENDLPKNRKEREKVILDVYGSPDARQIDGLGGADVLTSKTAIVGVSSRPDADVDYTFGQVSIDRPEISWAINCGNISSGVGPFAVDEGLVEAVEPVTRVRVHNTNTGKIIVETVPVKNGKFNPVGDYKIDGVPGTGSKITLDFSGTAGSVTGKLLPTGNARDVINVEGLGPVAFSVVDAGNLYSFFFARDLGICGTEDTREIMADRAVLGKAELIRGAVSQLLGFVEKASDASTLSPTLPQSILVLPAMDYASHVTGATIRAADIDVRCTALLMERVHQAYPVTGTICTGVVAKIRGTIVNELLSDAGEKGDIVRIGHPAGVIELSVRVTENSNGFQLAEASLYRTARRIMEGRVYLKS